MADTANRRVIALAIVGVAILGVAYGSDSGRRQVERVSTPGVASVFDALRG
ncbi:hypothetical protein IAG25_40820 [Caballeronia sp. EK]|jgi:hypothetical protein|uniref:hypothetical protein n=1 Tax=Caballeronia TaxID=1827195 RepID=UPI001655B7A7|nr:MULTISPECIES: hypothetical protein [Caballeronia]MBC8643052.1 hypothetical protein [Caballeronia sp. EK]GJH12824.1 hypothetical protein CBA19CS11_28320 [Caballeronia novacaledonica]